MSEPEEWRPAPASDKYEVSSLGRARHRRLKRIVGSPAGVGYLNFVVYRPHGTALKAPIHREVCKAFNGPPPFKGALVRHLDGDMLNNRASNLAWGSYADNAEDSRRHGTTASGERNPASKLTEAGVREIRLRYAAGGVSQREIAEQYGVTQALVSLVVLGQVWTHVEGRNEK